MASSLVWKDLELIERLGEGQAGKVWKAKLRRPFRGHQPGDLVAVKRYKRWVLEQPGQLERIYRELGTGTRLHHANAVACYCLVTDSDNLPVLVMRYYDGVALEKLLTDHREANTLFSPNDAFKLIRGIAAGVLAIHETGALHRDVKPANVIIQSDGTPVVMDLGVVTETLLPEHTRTDQFLGSIRYAHPEYLTGESCGKESDAYSVGAVAYELLFGERFLSNETNWARLVARVVGWRSPTPTEVVKQCEKIGRIQSHEVAEAAYWVVRNLLWFPEENSLAQLIGAIDREFWKQAFYEEDDGTVHIGEAPFLAEADPEDLRRGLPWAWDRTARTTDGEGLHEVLRSRYWEWRCQLDDPDSDLEELAEIEGDLGFFFDLSDVGENVVAFANTLLTLYRYGRLPDFSA